MRAADSGSHPDPSGDLGQPRDLRDVEAREALADLREADLDAREARAVADESARGARRQRQRDILVIAEARDLHADARDSVAERRDREASLASFLNDDNFGHNFKARRSAALDRSQAKADRSLAASDRSAMADLERVDGDAS